MSDPNFPPPPPGVPGANPYATPSAEVADPIRTVSTAGFIPAGRTVDAGQGLGWFGLAWKLFMKQPMMWIAMVVVFAVMIFVANIVGLIIPLIPSLAIIVLAPVFMAGFVLAGEAAERGDDLNLSHLFAGFNTEFKPLLMLGGLYLALNVVLFIVIGVIFGASFFALMVGGARSASNPDFAGLGATMFIGIFVMFLLFIPIYASIWFAPALVVINKVAPFEAMKTSFFAVLKNIVPLIIYVIIAGILAIVASIPIGLGWFALGPVFAAMLYATYRDVFYE